MTVSMGVASLGDSTDSMEKLVQAADENLYRAKREGRNRVVAGTTGTPTGVASSSAIAGGRRDSAHFEKAFPRRAS